MGGCRLQSLGVGEGRMIRVVEAGLPGLMPQAQNAAHGHIYLAAGLLGQFPAEKEQVDDFFIHLDRLSAGVVVYRFQVVDTFIIIVNIEQLMVFQHLIMKLLTGTAKGLFAVGIAHNGGHRIKEGQVGRLIPLGL